MKKIMLLFLIVESSILQHFVNGCFMTAKEHIYVVNNLLPNSAPLKLHCASGDNDLENHILYPDQDFHWSFCANILPTTLFFCHLWWGSKEKAFDVYNEKFFLKTTNYWWWVVKNDGYYSGLLY